MFDIMTKNFCVAELVRKTDTKCCNVDGGLPGVSYDYVLTEYDVMKEYLIQGAELSESGYPVLEPINEIPEQTIEFDMSFDRKFKAHNDCNLNFYSDDFRFLKIWNDPFKYLDYLRRFESVCGPDFTVHTLMPEPMQKWNKFRNMALSWFYAQNGIRVIPNVNILEEGMTWQYEGLPVGSTLCTSSLGRVRYDDAREEFVNGFREMVDYLRPKRVLLVGHMPAELDADRPCEIINLPSRSMILNGQWDKKVSKKTAEGC